MRGHSLEPSVSLSVEGGIMTLLTVKEPKRHFTFQLSFAKAYCEPGTVPPTSHPLPYFMLGGSPTGEETEARGLERACPGSRTTSKKQCWDLNLDVLSLDSPMFPLLYTVRSCVLTLIWEDVLKHRPLELCLPLMSR